MTSFPDRKSLLPPLIGLMLALLVTGSTLDLMSMSSVILLMGTVAKNATQAGRVRLRVHGKAVITPMILTRLVIPTVNEILAGWHDALSAVGAHTTGRDATSR